MPDPSQERPKRASTFPWRTALALAALVALAALALAAYLKTLGQAGAIAEKFKTGRITETFIEQIPQVVSTRGDILEVATSRSEEIFTRSNSLSLFGDALYLGTTTSEIRVPAIYRYHIRLSDHWQLS